GGEVNEHFLREEEAVDGRVPLGDLGKKGKEEAEFAEPGSGEDDGKFKDSKDRGVSDRFLREEWAVTERASAGESAPDAAPFELRGPAFGTYQGDPGLVDGTSNTLSLVNFDESREEAGRLRTQYANLRGPRYGQWLDTLFPRLRPVPG